MEFRIFQPTHLHEKGKRPYSEDYIYPDPGTANKDTKLFMVCDGVGGSARGDMASKAVCKFFPQFVQQTKGQLKDKHYTDEGQKDYLSQILKETEGQLDKIVAQNPDFQGMATTLTYLFLSAHGAVIAWAGDSRVYHIREGKLLYKTEDHSLVNQLVKARQITEEEAASHPKKNVILRAVSGSKNATELDVKVIKGNEVKAGDIFFLCTDGILDGMEEHELIDLLSSNQKDAEIVNQINQKCAKDSNDNYSMYFIRCEEILKSTKDEKALALADGKTSTEAIVQTGNAGAMETMTETSTKPKYSKFLVWGGSILLGLVLLFGVIYFFMNNKDSISNLFSFFPKENIEFREDYDNLKEQVDGVEKALNVRGIGLQDSINVLSELRSGKIRGEWERRVKDSSLVGWVDLGKQIDNVRKRYNLLASIRNRLNTQMDKLCKDYNKQVETAGGPDVVANDQAARMTVEGFKEDFEKICNRVHGMDKAKEECPKKCPLMYTNGSSGTTSDSEEKTTSSITDEDEDDLDDQSGSLTYYGIDKSDEYWGQFQQVIYLGDNCFKALHEKTNKWGIYPREEINGKRYFFSSKNESVAFDDVSKYHNGVVKAIRGNEHYFITNKGRVIEAKVNEGEPKIRFSWVEQEFGSTCPGYGVAVIMSTSDTIYISKSGVYREIPPCPN